MREETPAEYEVTAPMSSTLVSTAEQDILEQATAILAKLARTTDTMTSPDIVKQYLTMELRSAPSEVFAALWLDTKHRVIAFDRLFTGTIAAATVHPRNVVRAALQHNAAACILTHNHPSGNPQPSSADIRITQKLKEALALIDVRVLDHIVIGDKPTSMAELNMM